MSLHVAPCRHTAPRFVTGVSHVNWRYMTVQVRLIESRARDEYVVLELAGARLTSMLLLAMHLRATGSCDTEVWRESLPTAAATAAAAAHPGVPGRTAADAARPASGGGPGAWPAAASDTASGGADVSSRALSAAAQRACAQLARGSLLSVIDLSAGVLAERDDATTDMLAAPGERESEAVWWEQACASPHLVW